MNANRRRKKRPNYGIRTVEVMRGPNGFGFTISGQQPCIVSCIVSNSPAGLAGLRAGDFLISVNGVSVSKITHDAIVSLIGNCIGPIKMTVADNYYSDSSDEELDCGRIVNSRKPKYMHKPRTRVLKTDLRRTAVETNEKNFMKMKESILKQKSNEPRNVYNEDHNRNAEKPLNISNNSMPVDDEAGPIEYKALVGYLGTIEMPKELLPNSRLQTVCSCIRKLRQEKRRATTVLMTILPTCLTLKDASNHILAIYPTNRVVYIGSIADRESRYFGLVTSAVCDRRMDHLDNNYNENGWHQEEKKNNGLADNAIEISNSCHVFVTDPKIVDHSIHHKKAEKFNINCTTDTVSGNCLEFPPTALYIVSLVQSLYKLQTHDKNNDNVGPLVANSPQPSASSNSDSGIGYRDDCGNISDRILVVEFPSHNPLPYLRTTNRPSGIDASNVTLEGLDVLLSCNQLNSCELNNTRQNLPPKSDIGTELKQLNNLNNIRACEGLPIRNPVEKVTFRNDLTNKQQNIEAVDDYNRLNCRAMPNLNIKSNKISCDSESSEDNTKSLDLDTDLTFQERAVDVPDSNAIKKSCENLLASNSVELKSSVDNISLHSSKSLEFASFFNVFKVPFEAKKYKRYVKTHSCDNLDKTNDNFMNYKLSPKVYGLSKPNFGSQELMNFDTGEKFGFGSLQDLCSWNDPNRARRNIAQSEPDVRNPRSSDGNLVSCVLNHSLRLKLVMESIYKSL